jgi:hypothetical protein
MNRYVGAQERNTQIPDWNQGRAKACDCDAPSLCQLIPGSCSCASLIRPQ